MNVKEKLIQQVRALNKEKKYNTVLEKLTDSILEKHKDSELYAEAAQASYNTDKENFKIYSEKSLCIKQNPKANYYLGVYYSLQGSYDEAISFFNNSLKLDKNFPKAYYGLGNVYTRQFLFEEAEKLYERAIQIDPDSALFYHGLGFLFLKIKNYKKAENYFLKAIQIDPSFYNSYASLGDLYFNLKKYEKSIEYYLKVIESNPKHADSYFRIAYMYEEKGKTNDAERFYLKSLEMNIQHSSSHFNLGLIYFKKEQYEKAKKHFKKYIELEKNNKDYFFKNATSKILEINKILANKDYEKIKEIISNIKKTLEYKNSCVTHFTGLSITKKIVFNKSKFRLSEGTYLNDTSEGTELFNFLEYESPFGKKESSIDEFFVQKPFIGSFVSDVKHNDLTMWRMYGKEGKEEAKGCAITMNSKKLISEILINLGISNETATENDFNFFKVAYKKGEGKFILPDEKETSKKVKDLNKFCQELKVALKDFNSKEEKLEVQKDVEELLFEIAFLFKGIEYQYENEVRFLQNGVGFEKKIDTELEIPKVYIELADVSKSITKITLGPKVTKSDEWAASLYYYLQNQGIDAEIHISKQPFK